MTMLTILPSKPEAVATGTCHWHRLDQVQCCTRRRSGSASGGGRRRGVRVQVGLLPEPSKHGPPASLLLMLVSVELNLKRLERGH
jgi:hypothetical protein